MDMNLGIPEASDSVGRRKRFLLGLKSIQIALKMVLAKATPMILPVIVPIHLKKFSFSGNAETLFSVLIMRAISSFCNLRV